MLLHTSDSVCVIAFIMVLVHYQVLPRIFALGGGGGGCGGCVGKPDYTLKMIKFIVLREKLTGTTLHNQGFI